MKIMDYLLNEEDSNKSDIRMLLFTKMKDKDKPENQYKITGAFIERCKKNNIKYSLFCSEIYDVLI